MSKKKKKKRQNAGRRRRRMRRPKRLVDARQWLSTPRETNVLRAYEHRYSVDRLCAIKELRLLGVAISEEYEKQVRDSFERRAKARAAKRAAKKRGAVAPASSAEQYGDDASIEGSWNCDDGDGSIEGSWRWFGDSAPLEGSWRWDDGDASIEGSGSWDADASIDRGEPSFDGRLDAVADLAPDRLDGYGDWPIEYTLLEVVRDLDLRVIETKVERLDEENIRVRTILEEDPEVLARCAWGLIFTIGTLSFGDADTGADIDLADHDEWMAGDMLRCLSFDRGRLCFHADHVRGRCMKTTIEIDREGKITLETVNRGEAAMQWLARLQGQKPMPAFVDRDGSTSLDPIPF